jgi:hypothetical protein
MEEDDLEPYLDDYLDVDDEECEDEHIRGSLSWRAAKNDHEQNYLDGE